MNQKRRKTSSLQTKIIAVCLLFLAVPSLIIGITGYNLSKNQLDSSGMIQLKNDVRFTLEMINNLNQEVEKGSLPLADAQEMVKESILGKKAADGTRPINDRFDLGEYGYLFIYDQKGIALAHPNKEGENLWDAKSPDGVLVQQELVKQAVAGGGFTTFTWAMPNDPNQFSEKITYSEVDPNWGWVVCAGSYLLDFNSGAQQILYLLITTLGISLVLGSLLVYLFARNISRPLVRIADQAANVSGGDLTMEPIIVKNRDEIGRLAEDFNMMVATLKHLVNQVRTNSEQMAASSEELTASASQTAQVSEHTAVTMQELAEGTDQQARSIDETDKTIKELASGIQQIAASAHTVSQTAIQASETAQEGNEVIQTAVDRMQTLGNDVGRLSDRMSALGEQAQNIGNIVDAISAIAAQTNLLALNAAIEAARAGEQGRGFAVVADEVRKLAEQSSDMTGKITESITTIQTEIFNAVTAMQSSTSQVSGGIEVVTVAGTSFQKIQDAVNEVAMQIHDVSSAVQQMTAGADHVSASVDTIKTVAEQASAGTQTVSAASEEQLASMEEITASATALSQMAEELDALIRKFKV